MVKEQNSYDDKDKHELATQLVNAEGHNGSHHIAGNISTGMVRTIAPATGRTKSTKLIIAALVAAGQGE